MRFEDGDIVIYNSEYYNILGSYLGNGCFVNYLQGLTGNCIRTKAIEMESNGEYKTFIDINSIKCMREMLENRNNQINILLT